MRLIRKLIKITFAVGVCGSCGSNDLEFLGRGNYKCRTCGYTGNAGEWVELV